LSQENALIPVWPYVRVRNVITSLLRGLGHIALVNTLSA